MRAIRERITAGLVSSILVVAVGGCSETHGGYAGRNDSSAPMDFAMVPLPTDDGGSAPFAEIAFGDCPMPSFSGGNTGQTDGGWWMDADAGAWDLGSPDDGGDDAGTDDPHPLCTGAAPLSLRLVPVVPSSVDDFLWTIEGGEPAMSQDRSPTVSFALPGTYRVSLAVAGATGQASAIADVRVLPAGVGAPCTEDGQCQAGMSCLHSAVDGGVWPGALAGGLCAAKCDGSSCAGGQACVDLSRSAATQAEPDAWRVPLCLPTCSADSDCRAGFACRELPVLDPGASQGGAFSFRKACFARVLGDVGAACADADGKADGAQCITGACASFGARDICTSPCTSSACPSSAVCATFTGDATHPTCIARCDVSHPCTDPLLDCQTASAMGALGFSVPTGEPANATFCAPKRCMVAIDCAPAGKCVAQAGASFCQP